MTTYRITRWQLDKVPKPLETQEIDAHNAGEACDRLGWKIGECSLQLISGNLERWDVAKERIRKAYQQSPVIADLPWGDQNDLFFKAQKLNDIKLIEAIALEVERMADIMDPNAEGSDIEERLTDTYLLTTFTFWRMLGRKAQYNRTHCRYCSQTGDTIRWDLPRRRAIEEDKALSVYVCLMIQSCWQKALDDGYTAVSNNRRRYVEILAKQGKTQRQVQEILRVSRSTVGKDFGILKRKGRL